MIKAQPRPEQPRPNFYREKWLNLNGSWEFSIDPEGQVKERQHDDQLERQIIVPFAPESELSGIGETGFMESVWYAREIVRPDGWQDQRILLHFGAIDWQARVFADGKQIGLHRGGSTGFSLDVTDALKSGRCRLVVHVEDRIRSGTQPAGKQSRREHSWGCYYTRTTGIWQSVWLEAAGECYLKAVDVVSDSQGNLSLTPRPHHLREDLSFKATASLEGREVASGTRKLVPGVPLQLTIPDPQLWGPESPVLYDLTYEVFEGPKLIDRVYAYCGLRDVSIVGNRILLNGEEIYHRFVLDQGFYPDGIWTAPSDSALKRDIELAMAMGFNGARLHQKVFEPRFHYWADRLGYLTWGESPSWGAEPENDEANGNLLEEWSAIISQCRNHPSIIAWSPHNESGWGKGRNEPIEEPHLRVIERLAAITRMLDPTRPVNDASGWVHRDTDIWTVHSYHQDPEELKAQLSPYPDVYRDAPQSEPEYAGQPYILDEFGGAAFDVEAAQNFVDLGFQRDAGAAWGYGEAPRTARELEERIRGQVSAINSIPHIGGWCYTQLTDVEQEQNGLLTYDRKPKLPLESYYQIFSVVPGAADVERQTEKC